MATMKATSPPELADQPPLTIWLGVSSVIFFEDQPYSEVTRRVKEIHNYLTQYFQRPVIVHYFDEPSERWTNKHALLRKNADLHIAWFDPGAMEHEFQQYIAIGKGLYDEYHMFKGRTYMVYKRKSDDKWQLYNWSVDEGSINSDDWKHYVNGHMGGQVGVIELPPASSKLVQSGKDLSPDDINLLLLH